MQRIYILKTQIGERVFLKIGRSLNPESRLKSVQTGCPMPIEIHAVYECDNAMRVEKDCHLALRYSNTSGEWFSCSIENAERIVKLAIENKTTGRMRKRYQRKENPFTKMLAMFSDNLDR